jgi:nitrate/nitrite-specific signal transduction histidine kinase
MVTADIAQLCTECSNWTNNLRSKRQELTTLKNNLQQLAASQTNRKVLQDVEHFQNQFHIQLINVHDLKHAIKDHEKIARWETNYHNGHFSDATWAAHEDLFDQYSQLQNTLSNLRTDFNKFSNAIA